MTTPRALLAHCLRHALHRDVAIPVAPGAIADPAASGPTGRGWTHTATTGARARLEQIDWPAFFTLSGNALVTPWLQPSFGAATGRTDVPPDVMHTIDEIARANLERNRAAITEWQALVDTLAAVGVPVQPLKGIAIVASGIEPHGRYRVLGDVDVLIAASDLERTLVALAAAGYRQQRNPYLHAIRYDASDFTPLDPGATYNRLDACKHHVPPVLRDGARVSVEIHIEPAVRFTAHADTLIDWARADTRDGCTAGRLSPAFHLLHAFQHAELNDAAITAGVLDWRHMLDATAWLRTGADLERVSQAMRGSATMPVFEAWCRQLEVELGLVLPARRLVPQVARRAARIGRRQDRSWRAYIARRGPWLARRLRQARRFRAELRGRFGPEPLLRQLGLLVAYLWRRRGA